MRNSGSAEDGLLYEREKKSQKVKGDFVYDLYPLLFLPVIHCS